MKLYPFKFVPILKESIWGGNKLKKYYNKQTSSNSIGESWELSGVNENVSVVSNGNLKGMLLTEILETNAIEMMGESVVRKFGSEFPLLIKLIDARENLSIQVHPKNELAKKRYNSFGKTEMWYILQNEPGAKLLLGFKKEISKKEYINRIRNNTIEDALSNYTVEPGEAFFIQAGIVHAIGAGIVLAEIQQSSDITYRIYDYNRNINRRLHIQESIDAVDFLIKKERQPINTIHFSKNDEKCLMKCEYFTIFVIDLSITKKYSKKYEKNDSFIIFMCLNGCAIINYEYGTEKIIKGETVLIPASLKSKISITGNAKLLKIHV
jgi:mannose-6-phosphate isomerase